MMIEANPAAADPLAGAAPDDWWDAVVADVRPDALDLVTEVDTMMAICAGQRAMRVEALRREALAEAAALGRGLTDVVERGIRLELAAALRVTEHAAGRLIVQAEALVHRYPQALDSLVGGRITERHADVLVELIDPVEREFHDSVVSRAVALAETQPVGTFRRALRKLIESVRYSSVEARHQSAVERRRLVVEPSEDGMAWLMLLAPAVEVQAIHTRATQIAKALSACEGERRPLDQLRADVVGDLLVDGEVREHPDEVRGIRATVCS